MLLYVTAHNHNNTKLIIISNESKLCGMLEGDKCYGKKVEWYKGD